MSGSQQSSRCSAIWNVMKRSRYMWLQEKREVRSGAAEEEEEDITTTYTVLLSCFMSFEENSLRMSRKARLRGGPPSPWELGSLNANSMPSLTDAKRQRAENNKSLEQRKGIK
ncbi:hypothetical protein EYF80_051727 [Liparis tanakae]|uniref:Uncharacterized protein n=1 Tax=Liparis tanakae TaxID=230148 RepID=A0A4Z2FCI2_9TELE|nr:hypothetical protein EYF80_051727 [Liparis tanakae]